MSIDTNALTGATIPNPYNASAGNDAFAAWLNHVEAGRVGNNLPCPPAVAAHRDAQAAQFAAYAQDHRRPARHLGRYLLGGAHA